MRDPDAPEVLNEEGNPVPDKELEDFEQVPLGQTIGDYMADEVLPHMPDGWVDASFVDERDGSLGKVGYEINFNRYFYVYKPPRAPHIIAEEIREMELRFVELMKGVLA